MAKTMWIADAGYLLNVIPDRFSYSKLRAKLEELLGEPFAEAHYLNSKSDPPRAAQDKFHTWLQTARRTGGPQMQVHLYWLKQLRCECPSCRGRFTRKTQGGVDVGIATLLLTKAYDGVYERVVLSAGDGDFNDAVDFVKNRLHKQFVLAVSDVAHTVSPKLQCLADEIIDLVEHNDEIRREPAPVADEDIDEDLSTTTPAAPRS